MSGLRRGDNLLGPTSISKAQGRERGPLKWLISPPFPPKRLWDNSVFGVITRALRLLRHLVGRVPSGER